MTIGTDSEGDDADKTYRAKKTPVVSEEETSSSHEGHAVAKNRKPIKKKAKVSIGVGVSMQHKHADEFWRPSSFYQMILQTLLSKK